MHFILNLKKKEAFSHELSKKLFLIIVLFQNISYSPQKKKKKNLLPHFTYYECFFFELQCLFLTFFGYFNLGLINVDFNIP